MSLTMNTVVSNCSIKSPEMFLSLVHILLRHELGICFADVMGQVLDVSEIKSVPVACFIFAAIRGSIVVFGQNMLTNCMMP
uniref:Uncharacterized protein n=1 Tax=Noccaea caerulescens TaxID=107243 RepID=A0A1J3HFN6_NOCCA